MPLVRRTHTIDAYNGTMTHTAVGYVPPAEVRETDVVVEPTPEQLADLQASYPDEYPAAPNDATPAARTTPPTLAEVLAAGYAPDAAARIVAREEAKYGASADAPPNERPTEAQAAFLELNAEHAITTIKATEDLGVLAEYLDAETRIRPARGESERVTVLRALAAKLEPEA